MSGAAQTDGLDPRQQAVVSAVLQGPPGVVLATGAPGTGKSHTAQAAVRAYLDAGSSPDSALVLAPTRTQADSLGAALDAQVGGTRTEPLVRTPSSLAFAVLRHVASADGDPPPRLLTGAEQDAIIRDLLEGHASASVEAPAWPIEMSAALTTAGFRGQLRDLLMRAVEHGVGAEHLRALAARHARPQWHAAAQVLIEYEQVTALSSPAAFDPAYIGVAAGDALTADPRLRSALSDGLGLLVVDDAHELTASSAGLIAAMHHGGMRVLLLGDGDAVVHGFRGALPRRFVELADELRCGGRRADRPGEHLVLRSSHRQPTVLAGVADEAVRRIGVSTGFGHRQPTPAQGEGDLEVAIVHSSAQEAELVAHRLRRSHLIDGRAWSSMAVIARSGAQQEAVRRALTMSGVPVRTGRAGVPLAADPATRPLLSAYQGVLDWCGGRCDRLAGDQVLELLSSLIGRADPVALRRLRRAVRRQMAGEEAHDTGAEAGAEPASGLAPGVDQTMGLWVLDPSWSLWSDPDQALEPLVRLSRVLWAGREAVLGGDGEPRAEASAHRVLWAIWAASGLARIWESASLGAGAAGARADRHLDAVMVLFGAAQDYTHRLGRRDPGGFVAHVAAQEVAADSLVARAARSEEVSVLTPQAAAGREWELVAVVGVQEGVWPNLRLRGSLLGAEALVEVLRGRPIDGTAGLRSAQSEVFDDELRQFYVALTRSSRRLLVTAVASTEDQPSAFIDLIDPDRRRRTEVQVPSRMTLRGVVAELRRDLLRAHLRGDPLTRDGCADLLRELAATGVPWADPATWLDGRAVSTRSARVPEGPVRVSPSKVQSYAECALRWLLTSHGGDGQPQLASSVGTLVHEVVAADPEASQEALTQTLRRRWIELGEDPSWVATRALAHAEAMIGRFVAYRAGAAADGRELVGVEQPATVDVGRARLVGQVDRLERTADGSFVVVDLKTGSSKPAVAEIGGHPQLAAYQVAVVEGGFAALTGPAPSSAGAALAHIGRRGVRSGRPQMQGPVSEAGDPRWAHALLEGSAEGMAGFLFPATVGPWCRSCVVRTCCPMQPEGDRQ